MCDYSLEHVASREAVVADQLVTTRFNTSITIGFSSTTDTEHRGMFAARDGAGFRRSTTLSAALRVLAQNSARYSGAFSADRLACCQDAP